LPSGPASAQIGGGSFRSYLEDHLQRLYEDIQSTTRKLELEQRRLHKVDKDLLTAEVEYGQKRQRYKTLHRSQEDTAESQKRDPFKIVLRKGDDPVANKIAEVRKLELHLEQQIGDLNQGATENENLREQIDQLRKERKILNTVFKQLEKGIHRSGKQLGELMTKINNDQLASEDAKQRAFSRNKLLERERLHFHQEVKDATVKVKEEENVQRGQDLRERGQIKEAGAGGAGKHNRRTTYMIADEEEAFSEVAIKRRILKLSFLNAIQRRHIKQHHKNIEVFEQAFATIKSTTGISDIEEIVKIFIGLEQRNFSLLTYVNQLNREIESIEIRNKELQAQLANHKLQETQSVANRKSAMSDLSAQISQTKSATKETNAACDETSGVLEDARPRIWSIVKYLRRELPKLVQAAYDGDMPQMKITAPDEQEENLNTYLTFIEEALMQFRVCLHAPAVSLQPPAKSGGVVKRPTDLPSSMHGAGDDSDDDPDANTGERAFTRSELKKRAQASIQQRRKKPGQQNKHVDGGRPEAIDEGLPDAMRKNTGPATPAI